MPHKQQLPEQQVRYKNAATAMQKFIYLVQKVFLAEHLEATLLLKPVHQTQEQEAQQELPLTVSMLLDLKRNLLEFGKKSQR